MNRILNLTARSDRFLKPGRSLLLLMLCCFHAPAFADLNTGLVAYWSFDDCTANDKSGKGNNGTKYGTQCVQGKIGKALNFNGIDNYISVNDALDLRATNKLQSVSLFIKPIFRTTAGHVTIIRKGVSCNIPGWSMDFFDFTINKPINFMAWDSWNPSWNISSSENLTQNQWYHVVIVSNGNLATMYLNGKPIGTSAVNSNINIETDSPIFIGAAPPGACGGAFHNPYNGDIDEVRIYNRTLTPAEVGALYQQGNNEDNLTVSARKDTSNPNAVLATCQITPPSGSTIIDYAWTGFEATTKYTKGSSRLLTLAPGTYKPSCAVRFSNGGSPFTTKLIHRVIHKTIDIAATTVDLPVSEIKIPLDADKDALPDAWENYGVDRYQNSFGNLSFTKDAYYTTQRYLPLNKMGADALCKDIFVHVDHMGTPIGGDGHTHNLTKNAMEKVRKPFLNAPVDNPESCGHKGINLHVDYSPAGVMYFNPQTSKTKYWGTYSKATELVHDDLISHNAQTRDDMNILEEDFKDNYKDKYFPIERRGIFHYVVSGHFIFTGEKSSGVSLGNANDTSPAASDFVVTLGDFVNSTTKNSGTDMEQSGTFMHELGHNLGLHHGGFIGQNAIGDEINFKPNHFSIMNYAFQFRGLTYYYNAIDTSIKATNGLLDYSRINISNDLWEAYLVEADGVKTSSTLGTSGYPASFNNYGVFYTCKKGVFFEEILKKGAVVNHAIDWNCDKDSIDNGVAANINVYNLDVKDSNNNETFKATLSEWDKLVYTGSDIARRAIGGAFDNHITDPLLAMKSKVSHKKFNEIDINILRSLPVTHAVQVLGKSTVKIIAGGNYQLTYRIKNTGLRADTYKIETSSQNGWQMILPIQTQITLQPKQWLDVHINVSAPFSFPDKAAIKDVITLRTISTTNENISDSIETQLRLK